MISWTRTSASFRSGPPSGGINAHFAIASSQWPCWIAAKERDPAAIGRPDRVVVASRIGRQPQGRAGADLLHVDVGVLLPRPVQANATWLPSGERRDRAPAQERGEGDGPDWLLRSRGRPACHASTRGQRDRQRRPAQRHRDEEGRTAGRGRARSRVLEVVERHLQVRHRLIAPRRILSKATQDRSFPGRAGWAGRAGGAASAPR